MNRVPHSCVGIFESEKIVLLFPSTVCHFMLISSFSWSSGLCPIAIFFSRIRRLSLRSASMATLVRPSRRLLFEYSAQVVQEASSTGEYGRSIVHVVQEVLGILITLRR